METFSEGEDVGGSNKFLKGILLDKHETFALTFTYVSKLSQNLVWKPYVFYS